MSTTSRTAAAEAPFRVVAVGRLVPRKGFGDAIEAIAQLPGHRAPHRGRAGTGAHGQRPGGGAPAGPRRAVRRGRPRPAARAGAPRSAARPAALRRRRGVYAVVRTVRDRAAGGDGLRSSGRGGRRRRAPRHRGRRASPGCTSRPATRRRSRPPSDNCSRRPVARRCAYGNAAAARVRERFSWSQVAARTSALYHAGTRTEDLRIASRPPSPADASCGRSPRHEQHRTGACGSSSRAVVLGGAGFVGSASV